MNFDINKRYKSALEMRRDLEKCSFPGYWTTDSNNKFVGKGTKYNYRFDVVPKAGGKFDFNAFQTNNESGRTTYIKKFCKKNLNKKDFEKKKKEYFEWVINNAK